MSCPRGNEDARSRTHAAGLQARTANAREVPWLDTLVSSERRARAYAALERRLMQEPGVVGVTLADRVPGGSAPTVKGVSSERSGGRSFRRAAGTLRVGAGFFEAYARPVVAGRAFNEGDFTSDARTVIVNEAFARVFAQQTGLASPMGARLRYFARSGAPATQASFEIVGIVRNLGLDPDDQGVELPYIFQPAQPGTLAALAVTVHVRDDPAPLVARLPLIASHVSTGFAVREVRPLGEWIWRRDLSTIVPVGALAAVDALVLLLSAMGIFSLMSVSVSRRTREIGLRAALGATTRDVTSGILRRAMVLMGSGVAVGGAIVRLSVALGAGPTGRAGGDVATFIVWLGATSAVMLLACVLACIAPARRALRISPIAALRDM